MMRYVELSVHVLFSRCSWVESKPRAEVRDGYVLQRDEPYDILDGCSAVLCGIRLIWGKDE